MIIYRLGLGFEDWGAGDKASSRRRQGVLAWASAAEGKGAVPPLDFHTWY